MFVEAPTTLGSGADDDGGAGDLAEATNRGLTWPMVGFLVSSGATEPVAFFGVAGDMGDLVSGCCTLGVVRLVEAGLESTTVVTAVDELVVPDNVVTLLKIPVVNEEVKVDERAAVVTIEVVFTPDGPVESTLLVVPVRLALLVNDGTEGNTPGDTWGLLTLIGIVTTFVARDIFVPLLVLTSKEGSLDVVTELLTLVVVGTGATLNKSDFRLEEHGMVGMCLGSAEPLNAG